MMLDLKWFKHAFGIDQPGPATPPEAQRVLIDTLCVEVVRRRLTAPALLVLEMSRPLNYVSAQVLHFFEPFLAALTDTEGYQQFAQFLEQRGSIDYICQRLEAVAAQTAKKEGAEGSGPRPDMADNQMPERHGEK